MTHVVTLGDTPSDEMIAQAREVERYMREKGITQLAGLKLDSGNDVDIEMLQRIALSIISYRTQDTPDHRADFPEFVEQYKATDRGMPQKAHKYQMAQLHKMAMIAMGWATEEEAEEAKYSEGTHDHTYVEVNEFNVSRG